MSTTEDRIGRSLARSTANVFLRHEFNRFGSYGQVGRALSSMVRRGVLVKAGYGIYVKARASTLSGQPVPVEPLVEIGLETMRKLGVQADLGAAMRAYAEGRTTQMPMAAVINVGNSRVSRRIGFGSGVLRYERDLTGRHKE